MRKIDENWLRVRKDIHEAREERLIEQIKSKNPGHRADMSVKKRKGAAQKCALNTDFLDWIVDAVKSSIAVIGSKLIIDDREGNWSGLLIPYRKLGMMPRHKYKITVGYAPMHEEMQLELLCGKKWYHGFDYEDTYSGRAYSTGRTPVGSIEDVSIIADFTQYEAIPGQLRIQTNLLPTVLVLPLRYANTDFMCDKEELNREPFAIDYIKVIDEDTNEIVYSNDFE